MTVSPAALPAKATRVRYGILAFLFFLTAVNFADRATLSIAGTDLARSFGFDAVTMGYLFSAFGWAYVVGQIPGGWLLDRFGSKRVYFLSVALWSALTLAQGFSCWAPASIAGAMLFGLRFLLGAAESPSGIAAKGTIKHADVLLHVAEVHALLGIMPAGAARDPAMPQAANPFFHVSLPARGGPGAVT